MPQLAPNSDHETSNARRPVLLGGIKNLAWILVALVGCFYVYLLNGGPTFYFDTGAYLGRGHALLNRFFDIPDLRQVAPNADISATENNAPKKLVRSVGGTRSPVYSVIVGALAAFRQLEAIALMNAALVLAAVWLPIRIAARLFFPELPVSRSLALVILASSLGSLPFYVAFLMPDIFAPVLIIVVATFAAFAGKMFWWEILLAFGLGGLSIVMHVSHIAIVALMLPVVFVVAFFFDRKFWYLAPGLVVLLLGVGMAEQLGFRAAVKSNSGKEVTILPFLTARLIQDQIGLDYLDRNCPNEEFATCAMVSALSYSDDPMRFTASHIIFSKNPKLGSFQFFQFAEQKAIANEQFDFFFSVLKEFPVRTTIAFTANTLTQARLNSVDMTLQTPRIIKVMDGLLGLSNGEFEDGRITKDVQWLEDVDTAHQWLYAFSMLIIFGLLIWPGFMPKKIKIMVVMLAVGILANALILGGVSQPASRYGSRVIWLVPFAAAFCTIFAIYLRGRGTQEAPHV